ncbi:MAG: GcrA family cell cycle regulator [Janthinobacterium lividum]
MTPSPPVFAGVRPRAPVFLYLSPAAAAVAALEPRQCRWPIGESGQGDFSFCAETRTSRGSYCALHAGMARARRSGAASEGGRA